MTIIAVACYHFGLASGVCWHGILPTTLMEADVVETSLVLLHKEMQVSPAQDQEVVQAFSPHTTRKLVLAEKAHPFDNQPVRTNAHAWPSRAHSFYRPPKRATAHNPENREDMVNGTDIPLTPHLTYSMIEAEPSECGGLGWVDVMKSPSRSLCVRLYTH